VLIKTAFNVPLKSSFQRVRCRLWTLWPTFLSFSFSEYRFSSQR